MMDALLTGAGTAAIRRGEVTELLTEDGRVFILDEDGQEHCCEVLWANDGCTLEAGDSALVWFAGDREPIVLGRIGTARRRNESPTGTDLPDEIVIEARKNLTLKCGEGSITIREDGKILIKGKDLVSHAQRMNRVKGGAVAIN